MKVLQEAAYGKAEAQTRAVSLALWVLRPYCHDEWLRYFWESAGGAEQICRSQSLSAAYNGIVRQVRSKVPKDKLPDYWR